MRRASRGGSCTAIVVAMSVAATGGAAAQAQDGVPAQGASPKAGAAAPPKDAATQSAASAAPSPNAIAEVVVTAEKRSTSLQRTPISITALSGAALKRDQVHSLGEIQSLVPGLDIGNNDGFAQITIRGIGSSGFVPGGDPSAAVNVNGIYVARPAAQLPSVFDVSGVEVLRGPQGTLYGRNATAGAINVTTTRPTDTWSGYGQLSVGNYSAVNAEGAVGGPLISDKLLFRIAGFVDEHDGYGKNLVTGTRVDNKDAKAIRGTLVLKPTSSLEATLIVDHFHERDHAGARHYFGAAGELGLASQGGLSGPPVSQQMGGYVASNLLDIAAGIDPQFLLTTTSVTGDISWKNGPFTLKSITGYRTQSNKIVSALDGGSVLNCILFSSEPAHQISEELQAHYDSTRLHATAGLYYFHENDSGYPAAGALFSSNLLFPAFGLPAPTPNFFDAFLDAGGTIDTTAKAAFGQATWEIIDGLSLTAGLRYSSEQKQLFARDAVDVTLSHPFVYDPADPFAYPAEPAAVTLPKRLFTSTTPKFALQYQVSPRAMVYATYAKGFKSGGYDITSTAPAFEPEKLTDYEGGVKIMALENRIRLNVSGFYYDYTNLQVAQVIGLAAITSNAATANLHGSEAELTVLPTRTVTIDASMSYLYARYGKYLGSDPFRPLGTNYDFSGNRLNDAPSFTGHLAVEKRWPLTAGSLALRGEVDYQTKVFFTPSNFDPLSQNAFAKANAFLTYSSDARWTAGLYVRNITDKVTKVAGNVVAAILNGPIEGAVSPPRVFGAQVSYHF